MQRMFAVLLAIVLSAAPALAADVDGRWNGMIETPMGAIPIGFTFKSDGPALTGTTTSIDGSEVAIKDGKVDGSKISFTVTLDFAGMPLVLSYTGVVSPAEIKLTADFMGTPFEFSVQKAKE